MAPKIARPKRATSTALRLRRGRRRRGWLLWCASKQSKGANVIPIGVARAKSPQELAAQHDAAIVNALVDAGWACHGRACVLTDEPVPSAMVRAVDALARAIRAALDGEAGAAAALERIAAAAESTESLYLRAERLCERWRRAARLGVYDYRDEHRAAELAHELRARVDGAFRVLTPDGVALHATRARSAGDLAARLIIAANAISPRHTGESVEKHEKRIRGAMAVVRSKASPARRRRPQM